MGSPYLSTNEAIVLSAHDLIINTVQAEAILTNQRLMLVDKTRPRILPQDILFTAIETVTISDDTGNDPVLSLSIVTPDGTRQPLNMVFPLGPRMQRTAERDEWATRIRELNIIAQKEIGVVAMELTPPWVPGPIPEDPSTGEPEEVVPAGTPFRGPSLSERRSRAAEASKSRTIGIIVAVLAVIAVVIAGIYFLSPAFIPQPLAPTTPAPTMEPTQVVTMPPTTVETQSPAPTPETTVAMPTQVQSAVPKTGVWVRVIYDGAYKGYAGAAGRFRDIAETGDTFIQLPVRDEIVVASITKGDNSGNPLTIEFYNEGVLLKTKTITKPGGTAYLDIDLKSAVTTAPTVVTP